MSACGVRFASGEELLTRTVVWTAGVRANALADRLGLTQSAGGRILVGPDLSLPDRPEVFVVGEDLLPPGMGPSNSSPARAGCYAGGSTRWRTGHAPLARPADSTFPVPRQRNHGQSSADTPQLQTCRSASRYAGRSPGSLGFFCTLSI